MSDAVTAYRRDAAGVVWKVTAHGVQAGGRWEVSDLHVESRGRGRLTATLLRQLQDELPAMRDQLDDAANAAEPSDADPGIPADQEWMADLPGAVEVTEQAALAQEWAADPDPVVAHEPVGRRRGPARDDDAWRERAEAMAQAWAERRPLVDALRELDPNASESALRQRIARARRWDREVNGGQLLAGVGYGRGGRS